MKVYDPRLDAIVESDNPALIARSIQFGNERQDDDTEARATVLANHCDEPVTIERWQDYDCPDSGIDFDLWDEQMVFEGDSFHCSGCWGEHVATPELVTQYERVGDEEFARVVPLQRRG